MNKSPLTVVDIPDAAIVHETREAWLLAAAGLLRPWFEARKQEYPAIRVSCGFTGGSKKSIGTCWSDDCSADKTREIFIHPKLDDPILVLATLLHELCHAVLPWGTGHGKPFSRLARDLGLEGKITATYAGEELQIRFLDILEDLGGYPHAALESLKPEGEPKKQGTRMIKLECPNPDCGYVLRTTKKWIEKGLPTCCCGEQFPCPDLGDEPGEGEGEEGEDE